MFGFSWGSIQKRENPLKGERFKEADQKEKAKGISFKSRREKRDRLRGFPKGEEEMEERGGREEGEKGKSDLSEARFHFCDGRIDRDSLLLHRIAVSERDRAIFHRLPVDRQAPRRPDFIVTAITAADRVLFVITRIDAML